MKKLLAVVVFCLPAFGQTAYSGRGLNPGSAVYGASVSTGGPLTYSARIDHCVHGYSTNAITVFPFYNPATETCTPGATTGQAGSALIFQAGASDPLPFLRLDDPTTPAVVNTSFVSPDFSSYSVFATDQTTDGIKTGWSINGGGAWGLGTANDVIVSPNGKTVQYFVHVIESRVLAHTCSIGNPCIVLSNVRTGLTCTPSATNYASPNCTHTQISSNTINFGGNPNDPPNTIYEMALPYVFKDTFTSSLTGGFPDGVSDSVTRILVVDFSSDGPGGSIPCSVVGAGYNSFWNGLFEISDDGSFTIGSAGGSPWVAGATVGLDTFINATHNNTGMVKFGFQATTPGVTGGTEPNWVVNCPTQGTTCTDGTAVWTNIGYIGSQGPGFDLFHFDPARGCRYANTRRTKTFNGTNEGPNWPSAGTPDPAGQWITDDASTCYKMGGTNCGTGGTVNLTDIGTLHGAGNYHQGRYGHFTPTGGGGKNTNYVGGAGDPTQATTGSGSCTPAIPWTNFNSWPNMLFVSGTSYTNGEWVASPIDHNFYKLTGTTGTYTTDPSADSAHWQYNSYYCYNYIVDWYSNIIRPELEVGPWYGADGHGSGAYTLDFRGGKYISHYLNQPQCQNSTTGTCAGQYVGAPQNPGVFALTLSLPSDGHPAYTNEGLNGGQHDLQPIFDPTAQVFGAAGVGRMPAYSGTPGNSGYTAAGYDEIIAFSTDGLQTLYRFGSTYNSGSNPSFAPQNAQGSISQDGKLFAWCSDFWNTRGDGSTGSSTCANPVVAMYTASTGGCVALNDYVNQSSLGTTIYQITSLGSATQGACAPLYTAGTVPTWSSCATVGQVCTDSVGVQYTNNGVNSCRSDVAVMDVTSAQPVTGRTINAASCSQSDVQTAINSASAGDTVVVPSGTCTWTATGGAPSVTLNKAITLQGQTTCTGAGATLSCTDHTIIQDNTGTNAGEDPLDVTVSNARVTGFSFRNIQSGADYKSMVATGGNTTGWRIDHNKFTANTSTSIHGIEAYGFGLIDHNYTGSLDTAVDVEGADSRDGTYTGDYNWTQSLGAGTANSVYIEANEFAYASGVLLNGAIDCYAGGRFVSRFNDFQNTNWGNHGLDSTSNGRSCLLVESYDNTYANAGTHIFQWSNFRGGVQYVFDETVSASGGSYDRYLDLRNYRADNSLYQWGQCGGSNTIDQNTTSQHGWACRDQEGRGPETAPSTDWPVNTSTHAYSEASYPSYFWGNSWKGSTPTSAVVYVCDNAGTCNGSGDATLYQIINNRDFYYEGGSNCTPGGVCTQGTATGTWANRPTTCTVGTGYWATDQGSWNLSGSGGQGQFYTCTSGNNWTLYYTPYTYPHP